MILVASGQNGVWPTHANATGRCGCSAGRVWFLPGCEGEMLIGTPIPAPPLKTQRR